MTTDQISEKAQSIDILFPLSEAIKRMVESLRSNNRWSGTENVYINCQRSLTPAIVSCVMTDMSEQTT